MRVEFIVWGEPMGKQRPRATIRGGHASVYTPAKTHSYEQEVKIAYMNALKGDLRAPSTKPMSIYVRAYKGLNKGDYKPNGGLTKKGAEKVSGKTRWTSKCDWDNLGKIISDSLNKLAYEDDSQIVEAHISKFYAETPRVEVSLWEIE